MGSRYMGFRLLYELRRRSGWLKAKFPTQPPFLSFTALPTWKHLPVRFFFESREALKSKNVSLSGPDSALSEQVEQYKKGNLLFFSAKYYSVTDWLTNPTNHYRYDAEKHWTEIPDLSPTAGDIKYVWEKSRFAFLYPLIRYDFQTGEDLAETVFGEIDGWINANPINCGPNWRCSQEISLRVLNWTFALYYYKNSPALTEERFQRIIHVIYWQMRHVEANLDFSRIAVRNNHAITETLTLYLTGLLYPFFPESKRWKILGKQGFEEEIAYQIYEDGTFLQFSMNYHRVVVQLLTWGIRLTEVNGERFSESVYERALRSVRFLRACQDEKTGWLPNYGNNDGALFFPLSAAHYRDYRPQLAALEAALALESEASEDRFWYGLTDREVSSKTVNDGTQHFSQGGYYTLKDQGTLTFIRCGAYKDRPFQADNLHLDIWVNGENLLRDAGSYLYNTDEQWVNYFAGTASHNTLMLGTFNQMRKGPRFVWYNWIKKASGRWETSPEEYVWEGEISAYAEVGKNILHRRRVTKTADQAQWLIEDWLDNAPNHLPIHQIWHPSLAFFEDFSIRAYDKTGNELTVAVTEGWYSGLYGIKESAQRLVFTTSERYIRTEIQKNRQVML
ncbi:MAG: alginate lyase family protein [Spirosomataceae bacterium]